jgi:ABC-type transport system involved in cytochrome c biogenesis permease subunit
MPVLQGWEGKKTILGGLGFCDLICYLGVNFLGKGLHSYGWFS